MTAIPAELNSSVNCLKERLGVDAGDDEVGFVNSFRALGTGADADGRERVANASEE